MTRKTTAHRLWAALLTITLAGFMMLACADPGPEQNPSLADTAVLELETSTTVEVFGTHEFEVCPDNRASGEIDGVTNAYLLDVGKQEVAIFRSGACFYKFIEPVAGGVRVSLDNGNILEKACGFWSLFPTISVFGVLPSELEDETPVYLVNRPFSSYMESGHPLDDRTISMLATTPIRLMRAGKWKIWRACIDQTIYARMVMEEPEFPGYDYPEDDETGRAMWDYPPSSPSQTEEIVAYYDSYAEWSEVFGVVAWRSSDSERLFNTLESDPFSETVWFLQELPPAEREAAIDKLAASIAKTLTAVFDPQLLWKMFVWFEPSLVEGDNDNWIAAFAEQDPYAFDALRKAVAEEIKNRYRFVGVESVGAVPFPEPEPVLEAHRPPPGLKEMGVYWITGNPVLVCADTGEIIEDLTYEGPVDHVSFLEDGRAHFDPIESGAAAECWGFYVSAEHVVGDPRETEVWREVVYEYLKNPDFFGTLRKAVEEGASSWDHPEITEAVLEHMDVLGISMNEYGMFIYTVLAYPPSAPPDLGDVYWIAREDTCDSIGNCWKAGVFVGIAPDAEGMLCFSDWRGEHCFRRDQYVSDVRLTDRWRRDVPYAESYSTVWDFTVEAALLYNPHHHDVAMEVVEDIAKSAGLCWEDFHRLWPEGIQWAVNRYMNAARHPDDWTESEEERK